MKISNILYFVAGVAVGFGAAYKFTKQNADAIAEEKIEAIKARYEEKQKKKKSDTNFEEVPKEEHEIASSIKGSDIDYTEVIANEGYAKKDDLVAPSGVSVIDETRYKELELTGEYEFTDLIYFSKDKVLIDDGYEKIDNPTHLVGNTFMNRFGDDGVVYVLNAPMKTVYVIQYNSTSFGDLVGEVSDSNFEEEVVAD